MGTWHSIHPFDEDKFYETVVPSLRNGLVDNANLFNRYRKTCLEGRTILTPALIATISSRFDPEFKQYEGYNALTTDKMAFEQTNPWFYEWASLFEFVVFSECAWYKPEYYSGKFGIEAMFGNTVKNSLAASVLRQLSIETLFTYHGMGIINWISNQDVKLLLTDFQHISPGNEYEKGTTDDFYEFLSLVDKHHLGLVYGADLKGYTTLERSLS